MVEKITKFFKSDSPSELQKAAGDYWSSSDDTPQIRDHSHWAGEGRWADVECWENVGKEHLKYFKELCSLAGGCAGNDSMLEWGPGGGSNILSFSPLFKDVYGVDISSANLDQCKNYTGSRGVGNFRPILIEPSTPECFAASVEKPLDLFLSTAVFQHFPSKEYGLKVSELAYESLRSGGLALIQTRFDNADSRYVSKKSNYKENVITFTSYTIDEFWKNMTEIGFELLAVKLDTRVNYAFYMMRKPN